jgi:hypothetical protein
MSGESVILRQLIRQEFLNRLAIDPHRNAISAFAGRFFEKHRLVDLLRNETDSEFLGALKAVAQQRARRRSSDDAINDASGAPAKGKTGGTSK